MTIFAVLVISSFLFIVPQNIYHTISARSFMAYMGVGESDISVHLSQTQVNDVKQAAEDISAALAADENIARYTVLSDMVFNMPAEDGQMKRLRVNLDGHTAFPVMFMKMIVTKDRYSIAILKSLGFTDTSIRKQYIVRSIFVTVLGIMTGDILANTLGERVGAVVISSLGATTFHFVVDPFYAYLFAPLLIIVCVYIVTLWSTSEIRMIKISEYIRRYKP